MQPEPIIPYADQHYEADPPSREQDDHDREVAGLIFAFHHIALPNANVLFELDLLLAEVAKRKSKLRLDDDDADELLEAVDGARQVLRSRPDVAALRHFDRGMTGAMYEVQGWAMTPTQKRLRPSAERLDHGAYLKILRNEVYSAHLLNCVRERDAERSPIGSQGPSAWRGIFTYFGGGHV